MRLSDNVQSLISHDGAFEAVKKDGTVVKWGRVHAAGDSAAVAQSLSEGIQSVVGNDDAFAAVKKDGSCRLLFHPE